MPQAKLTVSNGSGKILRVPIGRLPEFVDQGFYIPLIKSRTLVSNGKRLAEIPLSDLARYKANGFKDTLTGEHTAIFQLKTDGHIATLTPNPVATIADPVVSDQKDYSTDPNSALDDDDLTQSEDTVMGFDQDTINLPAEYQPVESAQPQTDLSSAEDDTLIAPSISNDADDTTVEPPANKLSPSAKRKRKQGDKVAKAATNPQLDDGLVAIEAESDETEERPLYQKMLGFGGEAKEFWSVLTLNSALHVLVVLLLAMMFFPSEKKQELISLASSLVTNETSVELDTQTLDISQPSEEVENIPIAEAAVDSLKDSLQPLDINIDDSELTAETEATTMKAAGDVPAAKMTGEMGGRSEAGRSQRVAKMGGTAASENAVMAGLRWMERHQKRDGGWSFDHRGGKCDCGDPGELVHDCRNAATGFALLTMMGAGNTPIEGAFSKSVERGVMFLLKNGNAVPAGVDLRGKYSGNGGMYTHAIATTALCEVLAMLEAEYARDRFDRSKIPVNIRREKIALQIRPVCQGAINFMVNAQAKDGSWGYAPQRDGDTSVVGWQIMALKSAKHSHVTFPVRSVSAANRFLAKVQDKDGQYGYRDLTKKKPSTTAIGIVCRMLSGVSKSNKLMQLGVAHLDAVGPAKNNMYYNYYATQVMMNWGGETWKKWNDVMRDQLVNSQVKEGHAAGSWNLADAHGAKAGRLYMTALCTMTLEVYYRHLPLYGDQSPYDAKDEVAAIGKSDGKKGDAGKKPSAKGKAKGKGKPEMQKSE